MNRRILQTAVAVIAAASLTCAVAVPAQAATKSYTAAQVAKHASPTNCWTSITGSVYNLTTWISRHPGGSGAITMLCGKDGTSAFNGEHRGNSGVASTLQQFKIGVLKK